MSKKEPAPSDLADKFMLRMPEGMRDRIKVAAEKNNRSMNAEIVATLEEKYPQPSAYDDVQFFLKTLKNLNSEQREEYMRLLKLILKEK